MTPEGHHLANVDMSDPAFGGPDIVGVSDWASTVTKPSPTLIAFDRQARGLAMLRRAALRNQPLAQDPADAMSAGPPAQVGQTGTVDQTVLHALTGASREGAVMVTRLNRQSSLHA